MNNFEFSEGFKKRTQEFSVRITKLYKSISGSVEGQLIGNQLLQAVHQLQQIIAPIAGQDPALNLYPK